MSETYPVDLHSSNCVDIKTQFWMYTFIASVSLFKKQKIKHHEWFKE